MGGCITQPKRKINKGAKAFQKDQTKAKQRAINNQNANQLESPTIKMIQHKEIKPRNKRLSSSQFISKYRIESNVGTTSKLQGPKFISNRIDGSCKVLRVLNFGEYDEKRLKAYSQLLNLDVYQDEDSNLLVLQEYYCGPTLTQLGEQNEKSGKQAPSKSEDLCQSIQKFISQMHTIITKFHQRGIVLGNLNVFSFRQISEFDDNIALTDLSFNLTFDDFMGHANKQGQQGDWQSFGYILQTVLNTQPPVFIPHKIQYMDTGNSTINSLLKGRKIKLEEINQIPVNSFLLPKAAVVAGYKLRRDVNKLLRVRKRRIHHPLAYYAENIYDDSPKKDREPLPEDMIHRFQTARIFQRIQAYIQEVSPSSEEAFLSYSDGNQKLKKLKEVFLLKEQHRKIQQLKQTLVLLK